MNRRVASWRFICATLPPSTAKVSVQLNPRHVEEYPGIWPQVLRIAGAHLVSPALWSGLSRMNLDGRLPESARQYLQSVHGMNVVRNAALLQQLDGSILALNNLGVVPMLIKGASYLKSGIFEDPAARITSDLDMVVMEPGLPTALDALQRVGYNPVPGPGMDYTRHRHCAPMFRSGDYACIELHRELVSEKLTTVLPLNEAWNASTEVCERRPALSHAITNTCADTLLPAQPDHRSTRRNVRDWSQVHSGSSGAGRSFWTEYRLGRNPVPAAGPWPSRGISELCVRRNACDGLPGAAPHALRATGAALLRDCTGADSMEASGKRSGALDFVHRS